MLAPAGQNKKLQLQIQLNLLAKELKDCLGLSHLSEALTALFSPTAEIAGRPEYEEFLLTHSSQLQEISQLAEMIDGDAIVSWLRVTFFILSRCDANWTLEKTSTLRNKQIQEIEKFIGQEANGGVDPETLALPEAEEDSEDISK